MKLARTKVCRFFGATLRCQVGGQGTTGAGSSTDSGPSAQQQAARKVTRMCVTIALTFTVTWLPYQLTQYVLVYGNLQHALEVIYPLSVLAMFNSCINPVVYALMWRPFRLALIQASSCLILLLLLIIILIIQHLYSAIMPLKYYRRHLGRPSPDTHDAPLLLSFSRLPHPQRIHRVLLVFQCSGPGIFKKKIQHV